MNSVQVTLQKLGYTNLQDFGNYWKTNAVYRDGDNPTALKIYKDTGVWQDYVTNTAPMPFKKLVELTLGTKDPNIIKGYVENQDAAEVEYERREKLEMERVYPVSVLKKLFPNYSFYEKRAINEQTQKMYQCGLASSGQMYRRVVFPIFNEDGQIRGFSGRKVDEDSPAPKWKHIGKKMNWVYPAMIPNFPSIGDEVILVESIGDSMALSQNGITNNLVTFGLDCGSGLFNYLISLDLKKITISSNNDSEGEVNRGLVAAIKILMKLSAFFDFGMLEIKLPTRNDFGEMERGGDCFNSWKKSDPLTQAEILEFCKKNMSQFNPAKIQKFIKNHLS